MDDEVDIAGDSLGDGAGVGEVTIPIGRVLMDPLDCPFASLSTTTTSLSGTRRSTRCDPINLLRRNDLSLL